MHICIRACIHQYVYTDGAGQTHVMGKNILFMYVNVFINMYTLMIMGAD